MTKNISILFFFLILLNTISAQSNGGFEGILLEEFYITDAKDSLISASNGGGELPIGSRVYRIFVDLAEDYKLLAIYGENSINVNKINPLIIGSTAPFYNHETEGRLFAYDINYRSIIENTVLLDSWFTTGRIKSNLCVPKSMDSDSEWNNSVALNNDDISGKSPKESDGLQDSTLSSLRFISTAKIPHQLSEAFGYKNLNSSEVIVEDGSIGVQGIVKGPTKDNLVLIAQLTTFGELYYTFNLLLQNTKTNIVEEWVGTGKRASQFTHPDLVKLIDKN